MNSYVFPANKIRYGQDLSGVLRPMAKDTCEYLGIRSMQNVALRGEATDRLIFVMVSPGKSEGTPTLSRRVRGLSQLEVMHLIELSDQPEAKRFTKRLRQATANALLGLPFEPSSITFEEAPHGLFTVLPVANQAEGDDAPADAN